MQQTNENKKFIITSRQWRKLGGSISSCSTSSQVKTNIFQIPILPGPSLANNVAFFSPTYVELHCGLLSQLVYCILNAWDES